MAALGRDSAQGGNPVIPLVDALRAAVGPPHDGSVHAGATSQDILDTAAMLVTAVAIDAVLADLDLAAERCATLAAAHRDDPDGGPHPPPAGGAHDVRARRRRLAARPGPGGRAAPGGASRAVGGPARRRRRHARRLRRRRGGGHGARTPSAPAWPCRRRRGTPSAAASSTSPARSAAPPRRSARWPSTSCSWPRARSPSWPRWNRAAAARRRCPTSTTRSRRWQPAPAPSRRPGWPPRCWRRRPTSTERAAGAWHAEWQPLTVLLRCTGSAASWLAESLRRLRVDTDRMRRNIERPGGSGAAGVDTGSAAALVDRILAGHAEPRRPRPRFGG